MNIDSLPSYSYASSFVNPQNAYASIYRGYLYETFSVPGIPDPVTIPTMGYPIVKGQNIVDIRHKIEHGRDEFICKNPRYVCDDETQCPSGCGVCSNGKCVPGVMPPTPQETVNTDIPNPPPPQISPVDQPPNRMKTSKKQLRMTTKSPPKRNNKLAQRFKNNRMVQERPPFNPMTMNNPPPKMPMTLNTPPPKMPMSENGIIDPLFKPVNNSNIRPPPPNILSIPNMY